MAEYIDRETVIEAIMSEPTDAHYPSWYAEKIKEIPASDVEPVRKWIPVTERMPEKNNQWVLCLCVSGEIEVLKFDYTMFNWDAQYPGRCYMENYVTHWMPMPEPPKGD